MKEMASARDLDRAKERDVSSEGSEDESSDSSGAEEDSQDSSQS